MAGKIKEYIKNKMPYAASLLMLFSGDSEIKNTVSQQEPKNNETEVFVEVVDRIDSNAKYRQAQEEASAIMIPAEGCRLEAYFCGMRWTYGFGCTYREDGSRVQKRDVLPDVPAATKLMGKHMEQKIFWQLDDYLHRADLNSQQMAALLSLFYNVNPRSLTGVNDEGVRERPESRLFQKLNAGKPWEECAEEFMSFCRSGKGEYLDGLAKRRALEVLYSLGKYTYEESLQFCSGALGNVPLSLLVKKTVKGNKVVYTLRKNDKAFEMAKKIMKTPFKDKDGKISPRIGEMLGIKTDISLNKNIEFPKIVPLMQALDSTHQAVTKDFGSLKFMNALKKSR